MIARNRDTDFFDSGPCWFKRVRTNGRFYLLPIQKEPLLRGSGVYFLTLQEAWTLENSQEFQAKNQ